MADESRVLHIYAYIVMLAIIMVDKCCCFEILFNCIPPLPDCKVFSRLKAARVKKKGGQDLGPFSSCALFIVVFSNRGPCSTLERQLKPTSVSYVILVVT